MRKEFPSTYKQSISMSIAPNTTFSWKNYTRPTPRNLLALAAAMRRIVLLMTGSAVIMEANKWIPIGILLLGGFLDELKNFFAMVEEDQKVEVAEAEFPSGDQVTLIKSVPDESK
jgi:hypothetical protein